MWKSSAGCVRLVVPLLWLTRLALQAPGLLEFRTVAAQPVASSRFLHPADALAVRLSSSDQRLKLS